MSNATIVCPHCGHRAKETIPTDACVFFYACTSCTVVIRPKPGDCCVFCSYSDSQCPSRLRPSPDHS
ncbi:MAG: GDCCVxC domain-containing (seleno)protein [Gemmatimonadota bacterium]